MLHKLIIVILTAGLKSKLDLTTAKIEICNFGSVISYYSVSKVG